MWPLIDVAVALKSPADRDRLSAALARLTAEDPRLHVRIDPESGQTVLSGDDLKHLDDHIGVLLHDGLDLHVGAPSVAYRETLTRRAEIDVTHKRATGGSGEFARVKLRFEPGQPNSDFRFASTATGGAVPRGFLPGVERGLQSARQTGLLAGFPVIDIAATLIDGAYHDLDSYERTFERAAIAAFGKLRDHGGPVVMEPLMTVDIVTPDIYLADVMGDLMKRRGAIKAKERYGNAIRITASAPLSALFDHELMLRRLTKGRARVIITYDRYTPVPGLPSPDEVFPSAIGKRVWKPEVIEVVGN